MTSAGELLSAASGFWLSIILGGSRILKQWVEMRLQGSRRLANEPGQQQCHANDASGTRFCLLELPDLAMDAVLAKLPARSLCQMAVSCQELRWRCSAGHIWWPLAQARWGKAAGDMAYREWQKSLNMENKKEEESLCGRDSVEGFLKSWIWPFNRPCQTSTLAEKPGRNNSVMAWYAAMESGACSFSAQVYNREHGNAGYMLSCYDATLRYDANSDSFHASYPPHGHRPCVIEEGVSWERVRVPPLTTTTASHELHASDCLLHLKPGDHVEVQWRRNKGFPFGWWYGVVGHVERCDRDNPYCRCHLEGMVCLEFNQYALGSRWRRAMVNRRMHREVGNERKGYYGGIRKLYTTEEISIWKHFWPTEILE